MRIVRALLLVLLALTLPVRGVMAQAMLCPPPTEAAVDARASLAAAGHDHLRTDGAAHDRVEAVTTVAKHHHDATSGFHTCNLCSACCSVPPVPSAAPTIAAPHGLAGTVFPAYSVPAPSFLSDVQERPPRSI